jgi:predicted DNA-binding transcriptional regulator YafY
MYGRSKDLLQLALLMQGSRQGVSLPDIVREFAVSRRTAERMRDAVLQVFTHAEEVETDSTVKRWRIPGNQLRSLINVDADAIANLALVAQRLRTDGIPEQADALADLRLKLIAIQPAEVQRRLEPDIEALMAAEGNVMRAGPRPAIAEERLNIVREAIRAFKVLRVRYKGRGDGRITGVDLEPHGILFGHRHYLVAYTHGKKANMPKLYALANIDGAELLQESFERRAHFDLRSFAERSFGIFQETPLEIIWRFKPARAADALEYHFHPTEKKQKLANGSVEVRFVAGGVIEMSWHLFTWGADVEVLAPASLRECYRNLLQTALQALPID